VYLALFDRGKGLDDALDEIKPKSPWVFTLNEFKLARAWAPYVPFTLSLEAHDDLWEFIKGNLYIIALLEMDALPRIASNYGYEAILEPTDMDSPLRVTVPGLDEPSRFSSQMLARIGMEFISPEWLVRASIDTIKRNLEEIKGET